MSIKVMTNCFSESFVGKLVPWFLRLEYSFLLDITQVNGTPKKKVIQNNNTPRFKGIYITCVWLIQRDIITPKYNFQIKTQKHKWIEDQWYHKKTFASLSFNIANIILGTGPLIFHQKPKTKMDWRSWPKK